jgi:hypothetical protein
VETMTIQLFHFQHSGISSQILASFYNSRLRKRKKEATFASLLGSPSTTTRSNRQSN